ncbi:MAG: CoB--CoM heterodisulfide reductase iron-sulfur subunit A family protein, partial [Deltaproteobacteria bacterium]|nr:CoB--CoM heterodisulfide reductase iron-sulfur subunit A family protein [Deltaproteobacteria bacterium]
MEKKLGVYICTGCGIGEALDIEKLEKKVPPKIKVRKTHPIMCSPEGIELIKQDIAEEGVNTAVIAACSRRVLYDVFDFGPETVVQRVNLREGVVWSHKPQEEGEVDEFIQEMAEDYLRMGMAEAEKILPAEPAELEEPIDKRIMVMGGGVTGLSAALEVARAGYEAVVIEKEAQAGGFAARMRKQTPSVHPYEDLQEPVIQEIIREAEAHPKVEIRTGTEVSRIAGAPGLYDVTLKPTGTKNKWDIPAPVEAAEGAEAPAQPPMADEATPENPANILAKDPEAERFGAVILATGWKPYELEAPEKPAEPAEAAEGEEAKKE